MNHLGDAYSLHNRYVVMRHGQSKANLQQIIISEPGNGIRKDYALTEFGRKQVEKAALNSSLEQGTIIYCSDFSRARETASIVRRVLDSPEIHLSKKLRERQFGNWEKTAHSNYSKIWEMDKAEEAQANDGVENVGAVLERVTNLIVKLEIKYRNKTILLVSHGDTLQILQAGFKKISPSKHRELPHLETAEIRKLELAPLLTGAKQ